MVEANQNDQELDQHSRNLLAVLEECQENCQMSLMHSMKEGGDFVELSHLRWLLDCAEICHLAINYFIRDSEYAGDILSICAFVCEDCAQSCEKYFDDEHMVHCAEICRNCAKQCRETICVEEEEEEMAEENVDEGDKTT